MNRLMLKSKIHRVVVTGADLHYEGSIAIDETLMEAADLLPNEQVHVLNLANGSRSETYVIRGRRNSGEVVLNGALARLAQVGDPVIILSYTWMDSETAGRFEPVVVRVNDKNEIIPSKP
jgi:aspartate 1-decarboxylase